ncbi:MAG: acyl-CoA thioesterase [Alphaproteobacteria bacterium]|nr:acyl-CoA thioesterase [Alphaproteobacteria bacterium SS10]
MSKPDTLPPLEAFPGQQAVTLRYNDTDRQGHVNNAVFVTLLESGRVPILYDQDASMPPAGTQFVIANLNLDFVSELDWRSPVTVGTAVIKMGTSSVRFAQIIVQDGQVAGRAETIIVLMDNETRRATPLPEAARAELEAYWLVGAARD